MRIPVDYNEFTNWPSDVAVTVKDGNQVVWCNHVRVDLEEADFGYADPVKSDWVESIRAIEVCQQCDTWRYVDGEWRGKDE